MPPVLNLDTEDLTAITAYVRSVQRREGFEPYPPLNAAAQRTHTPGVVVQLAR